MRSHELTCIHGVGHSAGTHGCDGCCGPLARAVEDRIIAQIEEVISWCTNKAPFCDTCETLEVVIKRINGDESGYVVLKGENATNFTGSTLPISQEENK